MMNTTTWQTETAAAIAGLDTELEQLLAVVRAFKVKAERTTRRIQARAERIADAIHEAHEAGNALLPDGVDALPMSADNEALLDRLADLPSGNPDDVAGAVDALVGYRRALADLAKQASSAAA